MKPFSVLAAALLFCVVDDARAQTSADMFKGKPLNVYVGAGEAGTNTAYARLIAKYIVRYLPGNPTAIVRTMPGAGGLKAANFMYAVAPKDGTAIGVIQRSFVARPLFGDTNAVFDATKFNWVGSTAREVSAGVVWTATTDAMTLRDAMAKEIIVGSNGVGSDPGNFPLVLNHFLGTRFRVVHGYGSGTDIGLAMERGEIQGRVGWSWGSIKSRSAPWIADKKIRVLVQMGLERTPDLPGVPLAQDLAKSPEDHDAMEIVFASTTIGWPVVMPPDVPADRVAAVRKAFDQALADPELREDAEKQGLEIDALTGAQVARIVERTYGMPKAAVARAREAAGPL